MEDFECAVRLKRVVEEIRDGIAKDRCDGDSFYAHGVNAATVKHVEFINSVIAVIETPDRA